MHARCSYSDGVIYMNKKINTGYITRAAIIASIYTGLNLLMALTPLGKFAFGPIQIRVSEAMTVLPALFPPAIPGLFIGCLLSNIIGMAFGLSAGIMDVIFGSLATLIAAYSTYLLRNKKFLIPLPPVVINAVVIGYILHYVSNLPLLITIAEIAVGQTIACYAIGLPLYRALKKRIKQ